MAWPFTPFRTYIARSTPSIKASDLNGIMDYIGHLFSGSKSIKKILIDGTGDQDASLIANGDARVSGTARANKLVSDSDIDATAGVIKGQTLRALATYVATSFPGANLIPGQASSELIPVGLARVRFDGGSWKITRGTNVYSALVHPGTGQFQITFNAIVANPVDAIAVATVDDGISDLTIGASCDGGGTGGRLRAVVSLIDAAGSGDDQPFNLVVYAQG